MARKSKKDKSSEQPTEIVAIIDRSGSMESVKSDAIGGFNNFLEEQKKLPGKATFTLIQFDHEIELKYNGVDISEVQPYTVDTHIPRGMTALYDAIGRGIGEASRRGANRKVIVAILTDGHENSSKEVTRQQVNDMISKYETEGWGFIFLVAGFSQFDAEHMAGSIGIKSDHVMGMSRSSDGVSTLYERSSGAIHSYRTTGSVDPNWKQNKD
jgi:Mg-chelatase subunit ChlD